MEAVKILNKTFKSSWNVSEIRKKEKKEKKQQMSAEMDDTFLMIQLCQFL